MGVGYRMAALSAHLGEQYHVVPAEMLGAFRTGRIEEEELLDLHRTERCACSRSHCGQNKLPRCQSVRTLGHGWKVGLLVRAAPVTAKIDEGSYVEGPNAGRLSYDGRLAEGLAKAAAQTLFHR